MARPWKEIGRYGSVGIELVLTILIASFVGHWFDVRHGGKGELGLGIGFVIGVAVAFRNLFRTARNMQRDIERAEAHDPQAGRWTVDEAWLYKPDESAGDEPKPNPPGGGSEPGDGGGRGA